MAKLARCCSPHLSPIVGICWHAAQVQTQHAHWPSPWPQSMASLGITLKADSLLERCFVAARFHLAGSRLRTAAAAEMLGGGQRRWPPFAIGGTLLALASAKVPLLLLFVGSSSVDNFGTFACHSATRLGERSPPSFCRFFANSRFCSESELLSMDEAGGNDGGTRETSLGNEPLAGEHLPSWCGLCGGSLLYPPSAVCSRPLGTGRCRMLPARWSEFAEEHWEQWPPPGGWPFSEEAEESPPPSSKRREQLWWDVVVELVPLWSDEQQATPTEEAIKRGEGADTLAQMHCSRMPWLK